jgi:hypothetical protein
MVHETPMLQMAPPFVPTFPLNVSSRDEERCRQRAGEVVVLNDTTGNGHRTRVIKMILLELLRSTSMTIPDLK